MNFEIPPDCRKWELVELPKPSISETLDPKEKWSSKKLPVGLINPLVTLEEAHLMRIGAYKYGEFNYVGSTVFAMTYVHAMERHLKLWAGGEDNDPDSGVSHLAAIRASCAILRTQQINGDMIDDRPEQGDVRAKMDELEALWLELVPQLDEQIKGMKE